MTATEWTACPVSPELVEAVRRHAEETPDLPASLALSVKQYDALCRLIPCQPVTPMRVAALRLKELTRAD